MATQNVCKWNKFGYCKHGAMCRKLHVNDICENSSCKIICCLKRHPKHCKFYANYKRCKFDPCAFLHVENMNSFEYLKKENENILLKINDIDNSLKSLDAKELETKNFIEKLLDIEKKVDILTNVRQDIHTKNEIIDNLKQKVNEMEEKMKVKDELIDDLISRIKVVEEKQNSSEKEVEKENLDVEKHSECETSISEIQTNDSPSDIQDEKVFECEICTYKTKSENGIKIHKARKHTYTCNCCNRIFTDQVKYSNHITECYSTYSYYDSPMSPIHKIPPRFPPRFPHGSPPRFPPTYPPRFPTSPMY